MGAGRLLELTTGATYVVDERPQGQERGTLLLVHGATVPHWEFDRLAPLLLGAGWRVVRFDLAGHGLSARPAADYSFELFLAQGLGVLDSIEADKVALLGHSFGAAVAAALASERPSRVSRLVLVAPLLDFMAGKVWARAFGLPGVGPLIMRHVGVPSLIRRRRQRYSAIGAESLATRFAEEARMAGYAEALASMFRHGTLSDHQDRYWRLRLNRMRMLVVAGSEDSVVPLVDVGRVRALLPSHEYVELTGAQHNLLLTHASSVAEAIAD
jgi:pimeloyl-ACP methyl ester carboxylesterase